MKVEQYRPSFFSGYEQDVREVESKEELFDIEWIKKFTERDTFHQFSLSKKPYDFTDEYNLMAEYTDGMWLVACIITNPYKEFANSMPKWNERP